MHRPILFIFCMISSLGFGYSQKNPAHHLFNTTLLKKYEHQIGISGNYKLGINEDLEIGTQGFLVLAKNANIYLRHRMFDAGWSRTVFTGYLLDLSPALNDLKSVGGILSVNSSVNMGQSLVLTVGIMDLIVLSAQDNFFVEELAKTSLYLASGSLDIYLSDDWMINLASLTTIYGSQEYKSDTVEGKAEFFFLLSPDDISSVVWSTFTYTMQTFNIEFGAVGLVTTARADFGPYLNIFWRIDS